MLILSGNGRLRLPLLHKSNYHFLFYRGKRNSSQIYYVENLYCSLDSLSAWGYVFQNVCYSTEDASSIQLEDRIHDPVNQKILNQIHLEKFSVSTNIFSLILSSSDHDSRAFFAS